VVHVGFCVRGCVRKTYCHLLLVVPPRAMLRLLPLFACFWLAGRRCVLWLLAGRVLSVVVALCLCGEYIGLILFLALCASLCGSLPPGITLDTLA